MNRSSLYYKPGQESDLNLKLMRLMDEHYLKHPYKVMGLRSVLPGPHISKRYKDQLAA